MSAYGTYLPLTIAQEASLDIVQQYGFTMEVKGELFREELVPFKPFISSAHAPFSKDGMRLNIAGVDKEYRQESINYLKAYLDTVSQTSIKKVNMHSAPQLWNEENQLRGRIGEYELLIKALKNIGQYALELGLELVIENNRAYWGDIPPEVKAEEVNWSEIRAYFGTTPEQWQQIALEVDLPNVGLCMDTSHISTYIQTLIDPEEQQRNLTAFFSRPELIKHIHWNDNHPFDIRGRMDLHLCLGEGSFPLEFHRRIKKMPVSLVLEHYYSPERLESELNFIKEL